MLEHDNPHVLADRSLNPKISDVYNLFNKWRKTNLGKRTGLDLFEQLEKCVAIYNEENKTNGGKALLKRYTSVKCKGKEDHKDQPLILAICTPLMARVHEHVMQSSELIFVDTSSSFDDFNNPMFVLSTSSAAGIVLTSGETANIIHEAMSTLGELLPEQSFFGKGSPSNIITDDSIAERDGLHRTWPTATLYLCIFHFLQTMWRWLWNSNNKVQKDDRQYLMKLIRRLVYATTIENLEKEYKSFTDNVVVAQYGNLSKYVDGYWTRRKREEKNGQYASETKHLSGV